MEDRLSKECRQPDVKIQSPFFLYNLLFVLEKTLSPCIPQAISVFLWLLLIVTLSPCIPQAISVFLWPLLIVPAHFLDQCRKIFIFSINILLGVTPWQKFQWEFTRRLELVLLHKNYRRNESTNKHLITMTLLLMLVSRKAKITAIINRNAGVKKRKRR